MRAAGRSRVRKDGRGDLVVNRRNKLRRVGDAAVVSRPRFWARRVRAGIPSSPMRSKPGARKEFAKSGASRSAAIDSRATFIVSGTSVPLLGSAPNACATIAAKPRTPRRKSIGRDVTNAFNSLRRPITTGDAAQPTQPKASRRRPPREHERARPRGLNPNLNHRSARYRLVTVSPTAASIASATATGMNSGACVIVSQASALARFRQECSRPPFAPCRRATAEIFALARSSPPKFALAHHHSGAGGASSR
jgi:hypothetical protein